MLLSISGMSTAGKTFVLDSLPGMDFAMMVSHTTRAIRHGELDQFDYNFVADHEFESLVRNNSFLERTEFAGYKYALLNSEIDNALGRAKCAVHVCTPSGALALKDEARVRKLRFCSIFIKAPIETVIQRHLKRWAYSRGKLNLDYLAERIATSIITEQCWTGDFNYIVPTSDGFIELLQELKNVANDTTNLPKPKQLLLRTTALPESVQFLSYSLAQRLGSLGHIPITHEDISSAVGIVFETLKYEGLTLDDFKV